MFATPHAGWSTLVGLTYARHPVRVLGVDPGLTRCGVGVVDGAPGRALALVRVGVIRTSATDDVAARLLAIETEIESWLDACQPDAVAVERVFSQQNVRTVMGTAQAGAIAIASAARRGLPVALHTPSEVKAAVTGNGRAGKEQVTTMVMKLLRITDPPRPADAADALALAICHLWRGGVPLSTPMSTRPRPAAAAAQANRAAAAAQASPAAAAAQASRAAAAAQASRAAAAAQASRAAARRR